MFGSGDYMKQEMAKGTEFGKAVKPFVDSGRLVPDDIVLPVVSKILAQPIYKSGVILDGFPRNEAQALAVEKSIPVDLTVYFHLPHDVLVEKLMGRRVCPHCGRSYNVASIMNNGFNLPPLLPKENNRCDDCHEELIQRSDDNLEVIENRLAVFERQTKPLLDFFGPKGKSMHCV